MEFGIHGLVANREHSFRTLPSPSKANLTVFAVFCFYHCYARPAASRPVNILIISKFEYPGTHTKNVSSSQSNLSSNLCLFHTNWLIWCWNLVLKTLLDCKNRFEWWNLANSVANILLLPMNCRSLEWGHNFTEKPGLFDNGVFLEHSSARFVFHD